MGIALNLYIAFGTMAIFTTLILTLHEHERFFHLLRSSLISFFRDLKFLSYRSCLVRVTQGIFFVAIVKGVISLISFSACLSFEYRKATYLFVLTLYPTTLLKFLLSGLGVLWKNICGHLSILSYDLQIVTF